MLLVVGLGNPGKKYEETRHNVGFKVIDLLAQRYRFPPLKNWKKGEVSKGRIIGSEVLLDKPQTFMNLSGDAVGPALKFYKTGPEQLIVVHDELDFEPGDVRIKLGGGHGGHNGLRSIINHVGKDFIRVRVGVGKPRDSDRGAEHVLSGFDRKTQIIIDEALEDAVRAVEIIIEDGVKSAMNQVNTKT
jgi:PTH1 family peptidyl-tRNA hydrolase